MAPSDHDLTPVAPLRETELADAEALVAEAGWNQTAADWRAFLALGTVHAIRTNAGRVIATAATLPFGSQFAWISMVLVTKAFQRRGLATLLLNRCIDDLVAKGLIPVLDATPAGRTVYVGLGFKDAWGFQRYACERVKPGTHIALPDDVALRSIADSDWPALCDYDATAFGADRSALLQRLRGRVRTIDCVALRDGKIAGFMLGRDGRVATQMGPLVADDEGCARALLVRALDAVSGSGPAFIDVPDDKRGVIADLMMRGFSSQRPLTRMLHKHDGAFDDGLRTFAVVGPEFG
jgi:GNAT superfamily N-acetyltransferase